MPASTRLAMFSWLSVMSATTCATSATTTPSGCAYTARPPQINAAQPPPIEGALRTVPVRRLPQHGMECSIPTHTGSMFNEFNRTPDERLGGLLRAVAHRN
jgi:hypothetical protein